MTKITGTPAVYTVKYDDGSTIDCQEHEIRSWLHIHDSAEWLKYCEYASGAFTYLENRVTNNCPPAYHFQESYQMWSLARLFNPAYAAQHMSPADVDALSDIKPIAYHNLIEDMKSEVHAYLAACVGVVIDSSSMQSFTDSILLFWRNNGAKFPKWAEAARILFAMTPNSASAERVFSLLTAMFDDSRASALSDLIEGSLMLKYNKAKRSAEKEAGL